MGTGSMVRDYVFVEDLVRMITPMVGIETEFDLYNLGSGLGHSVNEIIESIERVVGSGFTVEQRPIPATFVDRVVLNTQRYRGEFPSIALTPLEDGIRKTHEEIRGQING